MVTVGANVRCSTQAHGRQDNQPPRGLRLGTSAARVRSPVMALAFTLLFVDDDPQVRESIVRVLFRKGFRVLSAESAFCDIVMPGMSGIELAKKARLSRPTLKIMFATGYAARVSARSSSSRCAGTRSRPNCAS
jgi:PleD family two-component response regulator